MLESSIESYLVRRVKRLGGTCEKFTSPARRSVPDRLISLPGGRVIFVEVKSCGKKPTPLQLKDHERRRSLGCEVFVVDSPESVDSFCKGLEKWLGGNQ